MSNAWRQFQGLLPANPLTVGLVVEHNADGTSTIEVATGDRFVARGQIVAVDSMAFIRDGEVRGEAPGVTAVVEIEV